MSNVIDLFSKKDLEKMNNEIERKKNSVDLVIQIKNIYGQKDDISLDDKHDRIMESFFNLLEQLGKHSENSIGETVLLMNSDEYGCIRGEFLEKDNKVGLQLENVGHGLMLTEIRHDEVKH